VAWEDNRVPSDFSFDAADEIVRQFHQRGGQPAVSYGIVRDGSLVHAAGFGARSLDGPAPDERTVFRIASMSKSFTASAILLLRDAGALSLDDPAAKYVPELADWSYGAADAAPLTIRNLLTMTAGFPTDDPWGDRQQGLPLDDFRALLAHGVGLNWAPGTRFEYSNLGYAVLGLTITAASGVPFDEFIRTRLLAPLGMTRTGFSDAEFPAAELALGYRRGPGGWEELPFDPYGAFAPMGGVFSSVADLATWSAGFAAAFPPGGTDVAHPLAAASRRQMQLPQAVTGWRAPDRIPGGPPGAPAYYGFGLFIDEDPALGRVVSHSGGYPGFGSNMRWHLATGLAVIALGNGTYARMNALAELVLNALVPRSAAYQTALAPARAGAAAGGPWPATLAATDAVNALLQDWDDAVADALFTENVALDRPYPERRGDLALLRDRIGAFTVDSDRAADSESPAQRRWWLTGERGTVAASIQLNPQIPPRVQ
jgi:CubicO group peptidase (beta-lactamase class C family)